MEPCIVGTHEAYGKKPNKNPDKPLPCPRCESFDTKFCYFNNYNVNQPRHFCRKCQRYWTAGGLLRNVPRGAGRRRSKYITRHEKHGVLSDARAIGCNARDMAKSDAKTGFLHTQTVLLPLDVGQLASEDGLSASSTILNFGQQRPLCEVMPVHSLSMQQPNMTKGSSNRWCPSHVHAHAASDRQMLERKSNAMHSISCCEAASIPTAPKQIHRLSLGLDMFPHYLQEKDENVSSSLRIVNTESNGPVKQEEKGENLGLNNNFDVAKDNPTSASAADCSSIPWCMKVSSIVTPSSCTSIHNDCGDLAKDKAMPMPSDSAKTSEASISTSTWNGLPGAMWTHPPWLFMPSGPLTLNWANAYWHMPWYLAAVASSSSTRGPGSQKVQAGAEEEGCLWVPKTLRINDPVEAAQSSIWKTLGLDKTPGLSASKEDIKKPFQCEAGTQDEEESSSPSQHCNPAALSRSLTFNETT